MSRLPVSTERRDPCGDEQLAAAGLNVVVVSGGSGGGSGGGNER